MYKLSQMKENVLGTSKQSCECLPGYSFDGSTCAECYPDYMKSAWSNEACELCNLFGQYHWVSASPPTTCYCELGWEGADFVAGGSNVCRECVA
jgi:hypothetical protein